MTMATTVAAIRRMMKDNPVRIPLTAAISDTTDETITVGTTNILKVVEGQRWEHDDGSTGAERRGHVSSISTSGGTFEAPRGWDASTAATHSNGTYILLEPRFWYDQVAQAVTAILESRLYGEGLYEIVEHQVTSNSSTTGNDYNAPSTSCERFLDVYQQPTGFTEPVYLKNFTRDGKNVDTTLYSNGKVFFIKENIGIPGTDIYYVNCAHKLSVTTLNAAQQRIVELLAAATLLRQEEPRLLLDRQLPGNATSPMPSRIAGLWEAEAERLMAIERSNLRSITLPYRNWLPR